MNFSYAANGVLYLKNIELSKQLLFLYSTNEAGLLKKELNIYNSELLKNKEMGITMNYIIRLANENDLSGLCDIRNNKDLFTNYLKQFAKREVYLAIAEQDSLILGFGVLKLKGTLLPKLSDLYVKEDYLGNGIGSDLIRYRENIAKSLGHSEIFVSVDPIENPRMIKLISKHGYEPISDPYLKKAIFYNDDGTTYNKAYTRIDLKKLLNSHERT